MWHYIRVLKVVVIQASALPQVTQEITIRDIFNDHKDRIFEVEQRKVGLKVYQNILLPSKARVLCFHVMKASTIMMMMMMMTIMTRKTMMIDDDDDYNEDEEHGKLVTLMALMVKIMTTGEVERGLNSTLWIII